jgi:radical S-adenosyl methionine domain-containing protein 2
MKKPIAINYHLLKPCNARCSFCFATFRDVHGQLRVDDAKRLITTLRDAGGEKLTFAGGEPTLHPNLGELVRHAKEVGFVTCVVTNGFRLDRLLDDHAEAVDWVALSVDSADEATQASLGRGSGDHVANAIRLADRAHALGLRVKLNTVVTTLTWWEDLAGLVRRIHPARWKVFQVLPMAGQNDDGVGDLLISDAQFRAFVDRHAHLGTQGLAPIVEDNDAMRGSYVMVDPLGRFYGNATGRHVYSAPILEVGVPAALVQVGFEPAKFDARGGRYAW